MTLDFDCKRCGNPGHVAAECKREPARTRQELSERNRRYVQLWSDGLITAAQKTKWIADEIRMFPNGKAKAK